MKNHLIYCMLIVLILTGCTEAPLINQDDVSAEITNETTDVQQKNSVDLSDYEQLVPLEIVDSTARNSYEKYGIEFSGNCYACDLARIELSHQKLTFINVCDDENQYQIANITYTAIEQGIRIQSGSYTFTLTKIDGSSVYELKVTGEKLLLDNKRISTYYTPAKKLHKFKEHDCGDFQG